MTRSQQPTLIAAILGSGIATSTPRSSTSRLPRSRRISAAGFGAAVGVDRLLLTLGSLILIGGSLGDIYGERRVFAIGLGGFGVFSVVCALAPTIEVFIARPRAAGGGGALLTVRARSR